MRSYEITQPRFEHVESALRARIRAPWPDARPNADIRPPNPVPAIRNDGEGFAVVVSMRWGLLPYWSKEPKAQYASFNARAETIDSQPMFRIPFQQRHCLIPAHGWFEWPVSERRKQRWRLNLPDRSDFAFAGLWDHWERAGQVIESCTIIVCDAAETIRHVHDRMPVILKPADYDFWLHGGVAERRPLKALLVPYAGQLTAGPVGR